MEGKKGFQCDDLLADQGGRGIHVKNFSIQITKEVGLTPTLKARISTFAQGRNDS